MIFFEIMDIKYPNGEEPFAIIRIDTEARRGNGVEGIVWSKHWTREEAEDEAACLRQSLSSTERQR